MSKDIGTNDAAIAEGIGRRSVIGGSAALLAAVAAASAAGVRSLAAEETPSDAGAPAAETAAATALTSMATWGGALAIQAATYAAPLVAMYNLRSTVCFGPKAKAPPGTIWKFEDIATPTLAAESGYVSPNVNVIYGFAFADLGQEPAVLTAPDSGGRYYMIEVCDMWTHAFAYPVGGPSGYKGGTFAFVGPGWKGELPAGVTRIDCPTRWIELQPRVHVKNEADLPGAVAVLRGIKLTGLAEFTGAPALRAPAYDYEMPKTNPKVASSMMQFDDPMQFWSIFTAAMNENPPPQNEIDTVLPQFKYLGIEFGKPFDPKRVSPVFLGVMKKVAEEISATVIQSLPLVGKVKEGWTIPPANVGDAGADYMSRCLVAIFGLTANTPIQAIYYAATKDGKNQPLTGAKNYAMTFSGAMEFAQPVPPGFWSVTMYDGVTRYSAPNPINRYSLGSDDDTKKNADGSFTLYLQHEHPGLDKESSPHYAAP